MLSPTEPLGNCILLDLSVNPFLQGHPLSLVELRAAYYMLILWKPLENSRCWQDMFSPYLENFTPAFCAEAPEAESVN